MAPLKNIKKPLAKLFKSPIRTSRFKTQGNLAKKFDIPEPILSDYLNSNRDAPLEFIIKIAKSLNVPIEKALLAACAARCEREADKSDKSEEDRQYLQQALTTFLKLYDQIEVEEAPISKKVRSYISLEDFPDINASPWTVIVGDRREKPPQGLGDLLALSISSCDLMYLPTLGLKADTIVRSDKILKVAQEENLKRILNCNILVIGSPAVSLATREILFRRGATYLFNISEEDHNKERAIYENIPDSELHNMEYLKQFAEQTETIEKADALLATFRKNGFVDPVKFDGIRGRSIPRDKDYGLIALAKNPWSTEHIVCICAGVHGPGTAGALQMLSNPQNFSKHPWGGVITVQVADQARWEERFSYLNPSWETREYLPNEYLNYLSQMIKGVAVSSKKYKEVYIAETRLREIEDFVSNLFIK